MKQNTSHFFCYTSNVKETQEKMHAVLVKRQVTTVNRYTQEKCDTVNLLYHVFKSLGKIILTHK